MTLRRLLHAWASAGVLALACAALFRWIGTA